MPEHRIHLIGGDQDETATLSTEDRGDLCHITFRYRDCLIEASAEDYFDAFCQIRLQLEPKRLIPFCYGASLNVFPSGMSRSMGSGLKAYRLPTGRQALTKDLVSIFDSGPDVVPASVANQKEHFNDWIQSLKAEPDHLNQRDAVSMTGMTPAPKPKRSGRSWGWLLVLSPLVPMVFGFLMGVVRERLQSPWLRAAVAGCAFGILWLWVYQIRRLRR